MLTLAKMHTTNRLRSCVIFNYYLFNSYFKRLGETARRIRADSEKFIVTYGGEVGEDTPQAGEKKGHLGVLLKAHPVKAPFHGNL